MFFEYIIIQSLRECPSNIFKNMNWFGSRICMLKLFNLWGNISVVSFYENISTNKTKQYSNLMGSVLIIYDFISVYPF